MKNIELISTNCCGEIGDVIINGVEPPPGKTILDQSNFIKKDKKLWNFLINEPRGGVFKHINLLVPPKNPNADMGFIIMEPLDTPPMSGSNSICVATVLLEKNIIPITDDIMHITLEAPGGLIKVTAYCKNKKVIKVQITNLPSFVLEIDKIINVPDIGKINVSTAYGGDSFVLVNNKDIKLKIEPNNADRIVDVCSKITKAASEQLGFFHPQIPNLNYISFCMLMDEILLDENNVKKAKNTVCIRPKKLDRSPCGTGTSARMAYLYEKQQLNIKEKFISESILGTKFTCHLEKQIVFESINAVIPVIEGQAWITGEQKLYLDKDNPFQEGYRLSDTWPII
tara:strand:- start:848 stop:1870 length:1023 start_codon:yes stop_codon:yes gene_type:complete